MRTLSSIDTQNASSLACLWFECLQCRTVDNDRERMRVGHACRSCGQAGDVARLYFPIIIHILVDLTHQAFHSNAPVGPINGPQTRSIGTIVFFCALREALLTHFLTCLMTTQGLSQDIMERLLSDNKLAHQRFGQLFKSVVGVKWDDAIKEISVGGRDYSDVSTLMIRASEVRNKFMHRGSAWEATEEMAMRCVDDLPTLIRLFATLHNQYVTSKPRR